MKKKARRQKITCLFLVASFALGMVGCGGINEDEAPKAVETADIVGARETKEPAEEPTTATEPMETEDLSAVTVAETEIQKEKVLKMPGAGFAFDDPERPVFKEVSVHDPSVMKVGGTYYIIGSHMAAAKTNDLMSWTQISSSVSTADVLVPNIRKELEEALTYSKTDTFWAGDWIQLSNGLYYMYYCTCVGDSPLACIGVAVADAPEGPYKNIGVFLKSGMWGKKSPDGTIYDATRHPNCIDPNVFYDNEGKLWMVYGSYSGGIFIMEMDETNGLPLPEQGYGKKLLGSYHARIEAPYIIYSPETEYYYLFLSFGGLDAKGGYNIRVCRSKTPDGPYFDAVGNNMIDCKAPAGSFFDDRAIEPYGVKLMGNYQFLSEKGEVAKITTGYKSPGHNSTYYDEETGEYYLIFHTRFTIRGEAHEVRVHQFFMNQDGWPVVAPKRYGGETIQSFTMEQLVGDYKILSHGQKITTDIQYSRTVRLEATGAITNHDAQTGNWILHKDGINGVITIDGVDYKGVFLRQYDDDQRKMIMAFTAMSEDGQTLWGAGIALKD